ncbi:MAG: hypothetical protein ABFR90_00545 [Planctomycetota bacterium]
MKTTDFLLELGSLEQIQAQAREQSSLSAPMPFNCHIHLPPNFSAFETVSQAVELAAEQGVKVLGAGNYYDYSVYREFVEQCRQKAVFPLFGTEIIALETDLQQQGIRINDPGNPGKYYICGKGISRFEPLSAGAAELLNGIRGNDALRMREMTEKMARVFGEHGVETGLDETAVIERVVKRHGVERDMVTLQERHLTQAFQEVFFEKVPAEQRIKKLTELFGTTPKSGADDAVGIQNEIRTHLMKAGKVCFVPETFVSLAQAKELILELGGIPCYPVLADGSSQRCEYETPLEKLIETLKANQYAMVEFIPIRNSAEVLADYVKAIRQAGITVVAGTEHNTLDLLPIEPTCANSQDIPDDVKAIFWEGVCVLVGHAFLSAHKESGFVDANSSYNDAEERIEAFSKIGEAVLNNYFNWKA